MMPDITEQTAEGFWENFYRNASSDTSGEPSHILEQFAGNLSPGNALDLGCAKGDDVVWLAKRGWDVVGVDISVSAIEIASQNAMRNGVIDHVRFEQHDLAKSFPSGQFDLVTAMFLQTPFDFPRTTVLKHAASAVRRTGLLLLSTHRKSRLGRGQIRTLSSLTLMPDYLRLTYMQTSGGTYMSAQFIVRLLG